MFVRRALRCIADVMSKFNDRAFGIGDLRKRLYELQRQLQWQQGQLLLKSLLSEPRYSEPMRLLRYGHKVFSQGDEDGIIAEIFSRVGTDTKYFLEIGVGNGWENNTCTLLYVGWKGVWVEASHTDVAAIKDKFADRISNGQLEVIQKFVDREYSQELMSRWPALKGIDLFSLDIDSNDYHIIDAMSDQLRARVIVVEYNAKHRPPISWYMPYKSGHIWDGSDWFGASLTAWTELLERKGYILVGCNIYGVNAFFVRADLVGEKFLAPFTAENHYEPARYWIGGHLSGHPTQ